ncbi:MAG: hypothetical protein C4B56_07245 [Candidatus Methanophagaceae archaeon]|nr:MAG: hypothetical protein C4B56_07245 [Methanophagales archaeon]
MVRQRAIEMALITAMVLLLLIPASSANVNYSYELTTTGGTIIAEDDYRSLSPGSGTTNQYSLHVDAMNAVNGSCNHSLVEGEGGDEISTETNVTYLRDTTGRAPVLINGKAVSLMGGAEVTENIGSASSVSSGENATFYDGAIGFTTEVDSLVLSSEGKSRNGSESYYNITAEGKGKFTAGLGSVILTKMRSDHDWKLLAKKKTTSRVGVRAGTYKFRAHYYVSRS